MPIEWYEVLGATTAGALMAMNVGALVYGFVYHPMKKRREEKELAPVSRLEDIADEKYRSECKGLRRTIYK